MIQGFSSGLIGNRELIYETDLPSFQRDFASVKTLDHGTGPAITFTRASDATYFDANGVLQTASNNVPRFDHDAATGSSLGLLIEEARTNLLERSAEFDNAYWTKSAAGTASAPVVTANAATAPDGTASADQIDFDRGAGNLSTDHSWITRSLAVPATGDYTQSVWLKAATGGDVGKQIAIRNVANGSYLVVTLTSEWIRYTRTENATTTTSRPWQIANRGGTTADNIVSVLAWGAQLEAGAFPTSYIPTTTAAATRSADSAAVTPISSFYNGTEGTIYNEFSVPVLDGASTLRGVTQFAEAAAVTNRLQAGYRGTGAYRFDVVAANSSEATIESSAGAVTAGAVVKSAQAYKSTDNARSLNGAAVVTSSSAITTPNRERLRFGDNGTAILNGHIRKIAYWPKRLSNTLLQQLTT